VEAGVIPLARPDQTQSTGNAIGSFLNRKRPFAFCWDGDAFLDFLGTVLDHPGSIFGHA
jgi:hypothetical protein